jgi:hypothetical protein
VIEAASGLAMVAKEIVWEKLRAMREMIASEIRRSQF